MFLPPPGGSPESNAVKEAYDLLEHANECFSKGDNLQAITAFEKAVPVLKDIDDEYVIRCEYCMAICYGYLQRNDDAISLLLRVDAQNQQFDPMILSESEMADLFKRVSGLYLVKWKQLRKEDSNSLEADVCAEDAKVYLQKYVRMCQSGGNSGNLSRQLDAFRRSAALYYTLGDYQSSCSYYNQSLQLAERLHMEPVQLQCSTCIANCLVAMGRLSDAIDKYKSTLDFAMKTQADKPIQAQCTYRLGCALLLTRRYSDAILYFLAHERIASDLGDIEGRLHSLDRLITAYREIGDYTEANKYSQNKDLIIAKYNDSGMTNEMTSLSQGFDQTLRSNISAVEQSSQLSGMPMLRVADSFDNLASRTFDSGQGTTGQLQREKPISRASSIAFIDDGSSVKPPSVDNLSLQNNPDNTSRTSNKAEDEEVEIGAPLPSENQENKEPLSLPKSEKPSEKKVENIPKVKRSTRASQNKQNKKQSKVSHSKRSVTTLPPEDTEFLDMLTRASTRRLDDQRTVLKPLRPQDDPVTKQPPLSASSSSVSVANVDVHAPKCEEQVVEFKDGESVIRRESVSVKNDDLFKMVAKAQSRRLDDQRAVFRPLPLTEARKQSLNSPDIQQIKSASSSNSLSFSPTSLSLNHSSSKPSKARRFLSQLMK